MSILKLSFVLFTTLLISVLVVALLEQCLVAPIVAKEEEERDARLCSASLEQKEDICAEKPQSVCQELARHCAWNPLKLKCTPIERAIGVGFKNQKLEHAGIFE